MELYFNFKALCFLKLSISWKNHCPLSARISCWVLKEKKDDMEEDDKKRTEKFDVQNGKMWEHQYTIIKQEEMDNYGFAHRCVLKTPGKTKWI